MFSMTLLRGHNLRPLDAVHNLGLPRPDGPARRAVASGALPARCAAGISKVVQVETSRNQY